MCAVPVAGRPKLFGERLERADTSESKLQKKKKQFSLGRQREIKSKICTRRKQQQHMVCWANFNKTSDIREQREYKRRTRLLYA